MVVCAVKLCRNYTGKNIKPPEGISFHRFPTHPDQKQEWIRAIRRDPDWMPGTHCRVCSVHFENSDFKISETGRRILHKDAVPTKNLYQEERSDTLYAIKKRMVKKLRSCKQSDQPRLRATASEASAGTAACRVCLATDTLLFGLHESQLTRALADVTGRTISVADGLPQHICGVCCALLRKCVQFRTRCDTAHSLLEDARASEHALTTNYIRTIDRTYHDLTLPLSIKRQSPVDVTEIDVKLEDLQLMLEGDSNSAASPIDEAFDVFYEEEEGDDKMKALANIKAEDHDASMDNHDIYAAVLNSEVFVEVDTKSILKIGSKVKKRKSDLKRRSKKMKKDSVKLNKSGKEDVRNTKARKTDEDYEAFSKANNVEIVFLTIEEQIAEVQARKDSDNYKNSMFKCDVCFKGFTAESAFKNHKAKHDPSIGSYVCEPCGFRFPKRYKMLHHLTHHKMNFVCQLCEHVTKLPSKAKEHFKWHNGVKYPCHFCEKTFIKRTSQFNHMRNRHGSACCDICQEIFSGERGLSSHMIKAHKEAVRSRCETCAVQFHSESALGRHLDMSPGGVCQPDYRACAQCGDNFASEDQLNEHSKLNHWKEIKCEKCNANFENEKLYRMHRIVHKEFRERRPRSEPRGKAAPAAGKVPKHKAHKVPKIQKRMCEMCGLTWRSAAALRYHQRVHTGEKPHQCAVCAKTFRIQDSLQIHMNTHTGARPFKCPHCPKAFKSRTQNHKHQLVHTKVRRYRCDLCDKTFQTSTCVKTHIRTVHMKIPLPPRVRSRPPAPRDPHAYPHKMDVATN